MATKTKATKTKTTKTKATKTKATKTGKTTAKTSRDKVRAHRKRLREQGLRPIQIWVPDVTSREFVKEARRQSRLIARSEHAKEDQDFVDSISVWKIE